VIILFDIEIDIKIRFIFFVETVGDFPLDKLLKIPFFVQAPMSRSISIQIRNSNEQTVR